MVHVGIGETRGLHVLKLERLFDDKDRSCMKLAGQSVVIEGEGARK